MHSENNTYYPENICGKELDNFLAKGWYRMGQSIFTTDFILVEEVLHRVFWLRYNLKNITFGKSQRRIKIRNQQFNITLKPLKITDEIEDLYTIYKMGINFKASESVHYWLFEDQLPSNIFDTKLIEVRDKNKLIAVGIYDQGAESIAGIMNFYHPEYKRYSLGKYLMLLKIELGQMRKLRWYYPGYIVYQRPEFDYKLSISNNAVEVLVPELKGWQLFQNHLIDEYGAMF